MLLYAITQRSIFPADEAGRRSALLAHVRAWALGGVEFIQVREKDLSVPDLQSFAADLVRTAREARAGTRVLLNGPAEAALNAGCDGVHLHSDAPPAAVAAAHRVYARAGREPIISAACHNLTEIERLRGSVDLLLFSPVFEKITPAKVFRGVGLSALARAVQTAGKTPVLALGGVNAQNARACVEAGAAGIAAIRLFTHEDWQPLVSA